MDEPSPNSPAASRPAISRPLGRRGLAFLVFCIVCVGGAAGYAAYALLRAKAVTPTIGATPIARLDAPPVAAVESAPAPTLSSDAGDGDGVAVVPREVESERKPPPLASDKGSTPKPADAVRSSSPSSAAGQAARPYLLFRSTALGETYGRVSLAYLDAMGDQRHMSPLRCDRVYFAMGHGLCLEARLGTFTKYYAHLFDQEFQIQSTFPLSGLPSRARISPDGRLAAMTVFVSGHSYASNGFSTRTSLIDVSRGQILVDNLQDMVVLRDGVPFKEVDFNFWGVTFARDSNRYYATLATGGKFFLVEGDVAARQMRVVHEGVECPSLSPDSTRVAFKRRVGVGERFGRFAWRLHVLELGTMTETPLASETRSVDDQVEWLDNERIMYALPDVSPLPTGATHSWALPSDGSGAPTMLMPFAFSPAVVRSFQ